MPFDHYNAPASFQGYINKILAKKLNTFIIVYLDDILIYTENLGQPHIDAVHWVLEQLRRHGLFANLKKCHFHQDKFQILGFVISSQGISMEEERYEVVKAWSEPKSIRDILVFSGFVNFYQRFIQGFNKIAALLTLMLQTTAETPLRRAENSSFLTNEANLAFLRLRQVFTEAPILHHFDPKRYIQIETDAFGYAISGILRQLTAETNHWHPVAFFSRKMILVETQYETYDQELLAIVEAFKTWRPYLEGCKF